MGGCSRREGVERDAAETEGLVSGKSAPCDMSVTDAHKTCAT